MSNISCVYPIDGFESPFNNTFIVKDKKTKNVIVRMEEDECVFPLIEFEELIPYVKYYGIEDTRDEIDTFIPCN